MKKIFICSPYRGDIKNNVEVTKYWCKQVIDDGNIPVAPHLYFPQFLNDDDSSERQLGLELSIHLLKTCDELWICSADVTEGMSHEIAVAVQQNIQIIDKGDDYEKF